MPSERFLSNTGGVDVSIYTLGLPGLTIGATLAPAAIAF
jgi:hypothetical protein